MNSETIPIILSTASFIIAILFAIVGFMMKDRVRLNDEAIKSLIKKNEEQDNEISEIKMNYLDRFKEIGQQVSNSQIQIQGSIADLGTRIESKITDMLVRQTQQQGEINQLKHDNT